MIKDITIGQYYSAKSIIHKLDARIKIILTILFIVNIFLVKNFGGLGLMVATLVVTVLLSKVPFKMILKSIKPIVFIVIFTALLNIFYMKDGTNLLPESWFIDITDKGLIFAFFLAVRIIALVVASSLSTYTTTPTELTDAIEKLLSPLKLIKVPVGTFATMMTLALRFIPTLVEETDKIMSAQKARGADLETGGIIDRIKAMVPILIPLFVSSFRRANDLAFAMECRCYTDGEGRTRMKQNKISARDIIALVIIVLLTTGIILLNTFFTAVI